MLNFYSKEEKYKLKLYWGIISHISDGQKSKSLAMYSPGDVVGKPAVSHIAGGSKLQKHFPLDPAISLLGTYPIDRLTLNNSFTDLVIIELFVIAKYWKHSNVHSKELIK